LGPRRASAPTAPGGENTGHEGRALRAAADQPESTIRTVSGVFTKNLPKKFPMKSTVPTW
jgi:hypothetical protein